MYIVYLLVFGAPTGVGAATTGTSGDPHAYSSEHCTPLRTCWCVVGPFNNQDHVQRMALCALIHSVAKTRDWSHQDLVEYVCTWLQGRGAVCAVDSGNASSPIEVRT